MRRFYLIITTLLLASIGLLHFSTLPHLPAFAPSKSTAGGSFNVNQSER